MELPRIPSDKPTVVPAVAAKEYPDKYIVSLGVSRYPDGRQPCEVMFQAYNYDTKELCESPETVERMHLNDVWQEAERSPVFAQAMEELVRVILLFYQERKTRSFVYGAPAGDERDSAITRLHQIQALLGVEAEDIPAPFQETTVWFMPGT